MPSVEEFVAAHTDAKDPAFPIFEELKRRQKSLAESRIELIQFLAPVRGKHGWDVTLIDSPEVEAAAGKIEVGEGLVAETRCDIITYAELLGEIKRLENTKARVKHLKAVRDGTNNHYRNVILGAIEDHPEPQDLAQQPRVKKAREDLAKAEKDLQQAEAELPSVIAQLEAKKAQAAAILSKYN